MAQSSLDDRQRTKLLELFGEALDLPAADRPDFCAARCGNDPLLSAELRAMLENVPSVGQSFLDVPLRSGPPTPSGVSPDASCVTTDPDHLGPFRIIRRIGEGGMGIVYLAEQREPIERQVALKVIRPGMDTARVIARFETERQVLARMSHPGIARIHDAGTTSEGRPWFAMEWVRGEPWAAGCESLGLETRLALLARVCDAVQHAHQQGVIHRDLKPSNLILRDEGGDLQPVVIDFGIARAVDDDPDTSNELTLAHENLGTPEYMAPEQRRPRRTVDSRVDIYALGVVLYELITGERPLPTEGAPADARLTAPSQSLLRAAAHAEARVSHQLRRRARSVRGALDWINAKALQTDPERRYASASEFAADLRRFLNREPVLAGPPGLGYRLRTFARRHAVAVTLAGGLAATLVTAGILTVWGLLEVKKQRDAAARLAARLETALGQAEHASDVVVDWLAMINRENGPLDKRALIDRVLADVATVFATRPRAEARVRTVLGATLASIGEDAASLEQFQLALGLLDAIPDVRPEELHEPTWLAGWVGEMSTYINLGVALRQRSLNTAIGVFLDDQPEIARRMHALRSFTDARHVPELSDALLQASAQNLDPTDSRWRTLADFFTDVQGQRFGDLGLLGPDEPASAWAAPWIEIYRDRLKLPETGTRRLRAPLKHLQQLITARRFEEVVARCESLQTSLEEVLPSNHTYWALWLYCRGLGLCGVGRVAEGLEDLDRCMAQLRRTHPRTVALQYVLRGMVEQCDAAGLHERASTLRTELALELANTVRGAVDGLELRGLLGPSRIALAERIEACERRCLEDHICDPEILPLLRECLEAGAGDRSWGRAAAGWTILLAQQSKTSSPDGCRGYVTVLREACQILEGTPGSLYPHGMTWLGFYQLRANDPHGALETARRRREARDPLKPGFNAASSNRLLGLALARFGDPEAVARLHAAYEGYAAELGPQEPNSRTSFRDLMRVCLEQERHAEAAALARSHLRRLLRTAAPPHALAPGLEYVVRWPLDDAATRADALEAARRMCVLEPEKASNHAARASALLRSQRAADALTALDEAARIQTTSGHDLPATWSAWRALALLQRGQRAEARELFEALKTTADPADRSSTIALLLAEIADRIAD